MFIVRETLARLRAEGLLTGPDPDGYYLKWLQNATERGVLIDDIVEIARDHGITPEDFKVLDGLEEVTDRDGKSFFILPSDISGDDARTAVLMTYILNAGTDYGTANGGDTDFTETPYSSDEIQRLKDRQDANNWFSYDQDVGFVHGHDGQPAPRNDDLDLDRLLQHEERHSQQWAAEGYFPFAAGYVSEAIDLDIETWGPFGWPAPHTTEGRDNSYEVDAGLTDGGYDE